MNLDQAFSGQRKQIEQYEKEFKLPDMLGTERQRPWARIIRREFLSELLPQVMQATQNLIPAEASAVYASLDKLRAENQAKVWIDKLRPHQGGAVSLLLSLPAAFAAADAKKKEAGEASKQRQQKSRDAIAEIKQANILEVLHDLPEMVGEGHGVKQANFGRRCRVRLLQGLGKDQIESLREFLNRETRAAVWIGAFLKGQRAIDLVPTTDIPQ